MKIIADESVDYEIVKALREEGFEVNSISEIKPSISDNEVLTLSYTEKALLLTEDKDFGELVFRFKRPHYGIVLIRLSGLNSHEKKEIVCKLFSERYKEFIDGFTVIAKDKVRVKRARRW